MDSEMNQLRKKTADHIRELELISKSERVEWTRKSPTLRRDITIYLDALTAEQKQRLNEIEQELLTMAYEAKEETTTKTILKDPKKQEGGEE